MSTTFKAGAGVPPRKPASGIARPIPWSWWRITTVLSFALVAGCAPVTVRQAHLAEPTPCADSTYRQLKRQHPDSLSDRAWQRLQTLDRQCQAVRAQSEELTGGMRDHGWHWMRFGAGLAMVALMVVMMW